ncbi:hypothetical protein HBH64_074310 [Parastagonospora nodorum]|nr:hypothetical protein HBH51_152360 [Parastagonospora nodorum]KAH4178542.1 hypothetical protein HBH43_025460 [Parastagonospora nodorum]KAH4303107.1 hypothetical protein HBI01_083420 [Parastagonospora nodorum]KAH4318404.1 hypothetical protein HBI02_006130 [Parastagonospora nodorum]KAH4331761.1 hypothetical protein HBI00_065760 [Parastagonospora nodorum]
MLKVLCGGLRRRYESSEVGSTSTSPRGSDSLVAGMLPSKPTKCRLAPPTSLPHSTPHARRQYHIRTCEPAAPPHVLLLM